MQDMRTVKQSINVCHPRQDLRDESHLLSLERSNSISRVGSIVNPKYRFFRKIPHICAAHSANQLKSEFIVLPLEKPCNIRHFRLSNPQTVCTFPCFFPYGLKQGKDFYSPLTTLSSSRAELRFASLVEWA